MDLKRFAPLIAELLVNAGWADDGDELITDHQNEAGYDAAKEKAIEVETLVATINEFLPEDQRFNNFDLQQYLDE
ncbi:hypothetical protein D3C87_1543590 [compost metagenome]